MLLPSSAKIVVAVREISATIYYVCCIICTSFFFFFFFFIPVSIGLVF